MIYTYWSVTNAVPYGFHKTIPKEVFFNLTTFNQIVANPYCFLIKTCQRRREANIHVKDCFEVGETALALKTQINEFSVNKPDNYPRWKTSVRLANSMNCGNIFSGNIDVEFLEDTPSNIFEFGLLDTVRNTTNDYRFSPRILLTLK